MLDSLRGFTGMADPDPQPYEIGIPQGADDRTDSSITGIATASLDTDLRQRQVHLVVNDDQPFHWYLEIAHERRKAFATAIIESLGSHDDAGRASERSLCI